MRTAPVNRSWWLLLLIGVALAAAALQPARAQASEQPWYAWHLKVDFPDRSPLPRQPRIIYTAYTVKGSPANVVSWSQTDISSNCAVVGALSYDQDGYAIFNGASYIRCPLPPKPPGAICSVGMFWLAADVRLTQQRRVNPLFEGARAGTSQFFLSVPRDGGTARTRLEIGGQSYTTSPWTASSWSDGNRVLFGAEGSLMADVVGYFETQGMDWLGFMDGWEQYFDPYVTGGKLMHLVQSPSATWETSHGPLSSDAQHVYIGYSPSTGTYFNGGLRSGEIDPPGCYGG
ncbi:MAG: hypothetical protein DIU80_023175 [Chloroflexota bacterium]